MVIYPCTEHAQWKDSLDNLITEYQFYGIFDNDAELIKASKEMGAIAIKNKSCTNGRIAAKLFILV